MADNTDPKDPDEANQIGICAFEEDFEQIKRETDWEISHNHYYACGAQARVDDMDDYRDDIGVSGLRVKFCNENDHSDSYYRTIFPDG